MAIISSKGTSKPIPKIEIKMDVSQQQCEELLGVLQTRFNENIYRHEGLEWQIIQARLEEHPKKLASLVAMENSGGELDVIGFDSKTRVVKFCDCSAESPSGRRSICYDSAGQQEREKKGIFPAGNAVDLAEVMGIDLLTEVEYFELQKLGNFDLKTESWVKTPKEIRKLGGALFCDRRYGRVFVFHNSAPSFYASRGFRGLLKV